MPTNEEMRSQHSQANRDHAHWLREISHWRVDHSKALALLRRVEATILELDGEMEAHAAAIRDHHMHIMHHERELDADEQDHSSNDVHAKYESDHRGSMATHADVSKHHVSLSEQHAELMSNIASLFEAMADD